MWKALWYLLLVAGVVVLLFGAYVGWYVGIEHY